MHYLDVLRRRWHIVVGAVVLALTVAFLVNSAASTPPQDQAGEPLASSYSATALLLNTGSSVSGVPGLTSIDNATIARLATVGEIPQRVADKLGDGRSPLELASLVNVIPAQETGLLEITVVSTNPNEARRVSNAFATEIIGWLEDRQERLAEQAAEGIQESINDVNAELAELRAQIAVGSEDVELLRAEHDAKVDFARSLQVQYQTLVAAASAPSSLQIMMKGIPQAAPGADYATELSGLKGRGLRLILAGLLGLVAGVGIALLLDRIDTRIRSKEEAEEHFGAPVLAEIPYLARRDRGPLPIAAARPKSQAADAFRLLATSIWTRDPRSSWESRPKTILVTSGGADEGKTTIVANLAASFAEMGHTVLTLSCDFRRPKIHELLGVSGTPGLSEAIQSSNGQPVIRNKVISSSFHDFVGVIPSGSIPDKPGELLSSEGMRRALAEARQMADVVLLDSSPLADGDATLLLDHVDAVVVVARAGKTHASEAVQSAGLLARLRAPVRGVVLAGTESSSFRHYRNGSDESDGLLKGFSLLVRHSRDH